MYNVSSLFKQYITQPDREFEFKAEVNGITYDASSVVEFGIEDSVVPAEELVLGAVISSKLTMSLRTSNAVAANAKIVPFMRLNGYSGWSEWVCLGSYYVDTRAYQNSIWRFSCFDKLILSQQTYVSSLTYPAFMSDVFAELCAQLALTIDPSVVINPVYQIGYLDEEVTMRDMLSYIASAHAASIRLTKDEAITFVTFTVGATQTPILASDYFKAEQTNPLKSYEQLELTYNTDGETLTSPRSFATFMNQDALNDVYPPSLILARTPFDMSWLGRPAVADTTLKLYNPHMTQSMLDDVLSKIGGFSYTPFDMSWKGRPDLDVGDAVVVTQRDGTTFSSVTLSNKASFKGGLKAVTTAPSYSQQRSEFDYKGSIKQQIAQSIKPDVPYYGVTIGRKSGLKIKRSDGVSEATFNSDLLEILSNGSPVFQVNGLGQLELTDIIVHGGTITWGTGGINAPTPTDVGAETPAGAQAKADIAKAAADAAQTTANTAVTNAATAQTQANTATTNAATANAALIDIADDNKLTPSEKQDTKKEWDSIVSEVALNDTQATTFSITSEKTTYDNAYSALNTYITPLISSLTTTTVIVGTTFRSTFKTYYDARTALLNAIAVKAKTLADAARAIADAAVTPTQLTTQLGVDYIITGKVSANNIVAGTLTMGGVSNGNGLISVKNAAAVEIVKLDNLGILVTHTTVDSQTSMKGDGFKILKTSTGEELASFVGAEFGLSSLNVGTILSPSVQNIQRTSLTYYVNVGTGNDTNTGLSSGTAFKTIMKAINNLNKVIVDNAVITINVAAGTYNENVLIRNFIGGTIIVAFPNGTTTSILNGSFIAQDCSTTIMASGGRTSYNSTDGCRINFPTNDICYGSRCRYVEFVGFVITGNYPTGTGNGVSFDGGTVGWVYHCDISRCNDAIAASSGAVVTAYDNCGSNNGAGTVASYSAVVNVPTSSWCPTGGSNTYTQTSGRIVLEGTVAYSASVCNPPAAPTIVTNSWAASLTDSYRGSWRGTPFDVYQGEYSGAPYGAHYGCMWFGTVPFASITSVKSARLYLSRYPYGGSSAETPIYLIGISALTNSGAVSTTVNYGQIGSFAWNESGWVSIQSVADSGPVSALKAGTIKALALYDGTPNYAIFAGYNSAWAPKLEITYA